MHYVLIVAGVVFTHSLTPALLISICNLHGVGFFTQVPIFKTSS
jgi:hypothetical protein